MHLLDNTTMMFKDNCNVTYTRNTALLQGGAIYSTLQSSTHFKGSCVVVFKYNRVIVSGGALYSFSSYLIHFDENYKVLFYHNMVREDGVGIQLINTSLNFIGNSSLLSQKMQLCSKVEL